jgi:hypothetical protein
MKIKYLLFLIVLISLIFPSRLSATSWANEFVVWKGYAYVISDEYVTEIGRKIGQVTKYSDMESYTGNFSNKYRKGTNYYSIKGIRTDEAIAVQHNDDKYKKAIRNGKFEGEKTDNSGSVITLIVISLFAILGIYLVKNRLKK